MDDKQEVLPKGPRYTLHDAATGEMFDITDDLSKEAGVSAVVTMAAQQQIVRTQVLFQPPVLDLETDSLVFKWSMQLWRRKPAAPPA